ncbi:MAG: sigma-54 dependent transcriptional regulator [Bryobacterales bacterium]|nr:sigma-54 dependent transcriptional regulator [Bryobacteraceae bacterium]MDW8128990.1 sigma-54 dependent transcriptional regulator [Bryobacterales bacterium]
MAGILVVDDDPGFRRLLETILSAEGHQVASAATVSEAMRACGFQRFDLVLCDLRLPDGDGLQVLRRFRELSPETPFVVITAYGTVPTAVEAMKLGAVDFLEKPLRSPEELRQIVRRTLGGTPTPQATDRPVAGPSGFPCPSLIVHDPVMLGVVELARKVAPTNVTVLLTGESGTGKEVIARCIHANSRRANATFLALNCAALAPTLVESALFGHEKGAFTGAVSQHQGVFERAHGGTLFLDEIAELDAASQAKLLRVLQDRTFERVGGHRTIQVDVRLIAATNRDLKKLVEEGKFREDLYYRLSAFPLEIPPLRQRPADILPLARHFLARAARSLGKEPLELDEDAARALLAYSWPGNVRELENMMERVAILCEQRVRAADLPLPRSESKQRPVRWKEIEKEAILEALRRNAGNRTRTAQELGISLRTLQYRLKEYGIR